MHEQLFWNKATTIDEPVNETVNDAVHEWWKVHEWLLVVTSVYSPALKHWIPGLFLFINGASAEHCKHHFFLLFRSIAFKAQQCKMPVEGHLFVGVKKF